jgi:hypothetical protein
MNDAMVPETFRDDVDRLLDCFTGGDGGADFVRLCGFLQVCVRDGNDVPFIRQTARLLRHLETLQARQATAPQEETREQRYRRQFNWALEPVPERKTIRHSDKAGFEHWSTENNFFAARTNVLKWWRIFY